MDATNSGVDAEQVKEIRRLLANGGADAVVKRYGASALSSAEMRTAQRQRAAARGRAGTARADAAQQRIEREARRRAADRGRESARTGAAAKTSAAERLRRELRDRGPREARGADRSV